MNKGEVMPSLEGFERAYKMLAENRSRFSKNFRTKDLIENDTLTFVLLRVFDEEATLVAVVGKDEFYRIYDDLENQYGGIPVEKKEAFERASKAKGSATVF